MNSKDSKALTRTVLSERAWPLVRVALLQALLMLNIVGNLVAWGVFVLAVDVLGWLQIEYRGKTIDEVSVEGQVLGYSVVILVNLVLVLLAWRFLERKRLRDMWWGFHRRWGRSLLWGLLAGLVEVLVVYGILVVLGQVDVTWGWHPNSAGVLVLAAGWIVALAILPALTEESLYRGYWFQNVKRGWGLVAATVVSAALFGGVHLLNPNAELLGGINIALSAVTWILGMLILRSLWFPIGWHAAWNFAQMFICGLPNSGVPVSQMGVDGATLFVSEMTGPTLLTGGAFGLEASLVHTIVLVGLIAFMFWLWRRQAQKNDSEEVSNVT